MADEKMSEFGSVTSITGSDEVIILASGNKRISFTNFKTAVLSGGLAATLSVSSTTGSATIRFSQATASRVAILDSNKDLTHSIVTVTELAYLSGATNNIQTQLDGLSALISSVQNNTFWKDSVVVASTANLTLSGIQTIDGILLVAGNRVLVKDQTDSTENGIYICRSTAWERADDFEAGGKIAGATVTVQRGSVNADRIFRCTNDAPDDVGTANITFVDAGGTSYTGTSNKITITGSVITIASTYVGQTSITTLGTISTGVWQGSQISPAYLDLEATARTGLSIQFDRDAFYGTSSSPETGSAITINTSGARNGVVQRLMHQAASEPSYPGEFVKISGTYNSAKVNYYTIERISSTKYHVWIYQEP